MTKPAKILAAVGANDETVAHLRLLLRMGAGRLTHDWRWGTESEADFVVVEPGSLAADTIQTHCQAAGIPFAVLCEQDGIVVQGMALRRPLKLDLVVAVFNSAGASSASVAEMQSFGEDFYNQPLGESIPTGSTGADIWAAHERPVDAPVRVREAGVQDLDHLLFGDPLAEPVELGPLVTPDTEVDAVDGDTTARSESRRHNADDRMAATLIGVSTVDVAPIAPLPRTPQALASAAAAAAASKKLRDDPPRPLQDYLDTERVASPMQLRLDDAPVITLDPKRDLFHAEGPLGALAPYVERGITAEQTAAVAGAELARVRLTQPGRAYAQLRWLTGLLRSNGTLNSRLDPGGTFSVREPLDLDPEYRMHGAIAAAMRAPTRLHEIARISGAGMGDVFDIVNAYDAIGALEWTPRAPRQPAAPEKPAGSRLWPFRRK